MKYSFGFTPVLIVVIASTLALAQDGPDPVGPKSPFEKVDPDVPLPAKVIGKDDRVPVTSRAYPWRTVGKIVFKSGGHCTGTLVGDDIILTNAHCVLDDDGDFQEGSMFYPGYMFGKHDYESRIIWAEHGEEASRTDFAIARIASPLGKQLGMMGSAARTIENLVSDGWQKKLVLAGYSGDYADGETAGAHVGCSIVLDADERGFGHECDTFGGASGSALFAWFKEGPYVVGINWGHARDQVINYGVAAQIFSDKIGKYRTNDEGQTDYTYVQLCNKTNYRSISFAMAYFKDGNWRTEGWWNVSQGSCREVRIDERYEGDAYFHAEAADGTKWGGGRFSFCVNGDAFTNLSADKVCRGGRKERFTDKVLMEFRDWNSVTFQ